MRRLELVTAIGGAAVAVVRRDLAIFTSYRLRYVTQAVGILFSLTLFYYVSRLVHVETLAGPDGYFAFVVVGIVILQALNSTLTALPSSLHQELVAGTFERTVVSPFGPLGGVAAMMLFPLLHALVVGIVTLLVATLVFGLPMQWTTAPLVLPVAALAALAFAPLGMLLAGLLLVAKQASLGTNFIVAAMSLVSGLYFPVALLPDWIEWASEAQPFTPAVNLLRHLLVGTEMAGDPWLQLLKLAGFAAVLLPIALLALARALRYSRRRATIIEF